MNWMDLAKLLITAFGSMAGAGPWGIAAMLLGGVGVLGGIAFMIGKWNKNVDSGDLDRGGADAGKSAVELKNQADANREFERASREEILKEGAPK